MTFQCVGLINDAVFSTVLEALPTKVCIGANCHRKYGKLNFTFRLAFLINEKLLRGMKGSHYTLNEAHDGYISKHNLIFSHTIILYHVSYGIYYLFTEAVLVKPQGPTLP